MAFAITGELQENWRSLNPAEEKWAKQLLEAASRWILRRRPDLPADDPDAKLVSIAVVRGALTAGENAGHSSYSKSLGPRARSGTLTNPDAALVWADWMKELLGISVRPTAIGYFGDGDCSGW